MSDLSLPAKRSFADHSKIKESRPCAYSEVDTGFVIRIRASLRAFSYG